MKYFLFTTFTIIYVFAFSLAGQNKPLQSMPASPPSPTSMETEKETIAKCLRDLKSEDSEIRKRAALILGKYEKKEAVAALISQLDDPVADVRRTALVSLLENNFIPSNASIRVLEMMADSDVHIRRLASSCVPQAMIFNRFVRRLPNSQGSQKVSMLPPDAVKAIKAAFSDPDVIVRKNMITHFNYFTDLVSPETLANLLTDSDRDVRILALKQALLYLNPETLPQLEKLARDPDRLIRLNLASGLSFQGGENSVKILRKLAADKDIQIAAEALISFLKIGRRPTSDLLISTLDNPELDPLQGQRIIATLPALGPEAEPILKKLLNSDRPEYRSEALKQYGLEFRDKLTFDQLLATLNDPSSQVREVAVQLLSNWPDIAPEKLAPLVEHSKVEARVALVDICRRLPQKQAEPFVADLLLDDSDRVRKKALLQYVRRKMPDWFDIASQTLKDPDKEIRHMILYTLLFNPDPRIPKLLIKFAETCDDPDLKQRINSRFGIKR